MLTKAMFRTRESNRFGIAEGMMWNTGRILKGLWYNQAGEWIGYGDLAMSDIERIRDGLLEDELFVLIPEWVRVTRRTNPNVTDLEYVMENCFIIITRGKIYQTSDLPREYSDVPWHLSFELQTHEAAKRLLRDFR